MLVLNEWPKPLHYSTKLLRALFDAMVDLQREICPKGDRIIDGTGAVFGKYVNTN